MIFDFKVEEQTAQPVLSIRIRTSMENLPQTIGECYGKIAAYMAELGEPPQYAPFAAYYNMDMQDLDMELGFPVVRPLPEKNDIKAGTISPGKIVSCMYKGPYSAMEQPYKEIMKWIEDKAYEMTGVFYEYYYNSPAEVPESELLTRIVIPLK